MPFHRELLFANNWRLVALVALIGFQLRSVTVAVAPVLPELSADLHLSYSATGALSSTMVLGLGVGAIPGAILVNRIGARRAVGLAAIGIGMTGLLRLTPPMPVSLYFWSVCMSLTIAVAQPAMTVLIRNWFPSQTQQASMVLGLSMAAGGLAGATLSIYLLVFGGWRGTFAIWAVLALAASGVWILSVPGRRTYEAPRPHALTALVRNPRVWHVAALFGGQSLVFQSGITWIPFALRGNDHDYLALVLFLFQALSLPILAVLAASSRPLARSRLLYMTGGFLMTLGSLGFMLGLTRLAWFWASLMGLGAGIVFAGAFALPALLGRTPSEVAGYSALTMTAGFTLAFFGPLLGGILLDQTRVLTSPFWVVTATASAVFVLGAKLPTALPDISYDP